MPSRLLQTCRVLLPRRPFAGVVSRAGAGTPFAPVCYTTHNRTLHASAVESTDSADSTEKTRNFTSVIISHQPHATTPEEIISQIEPVPSKSLAAFTERNVVFFLTPTFSKWLLPSEDSFLKSAMGRIFEQALQDDPKGRISAYVLTAVVDRLPLPQSSSPGDSGLVGPQVGHEGLAYAIFPGLQKLQIETAGKEGERSMSLAQVAHRTVTVRVRPTYHAGRRALNARPDHFWYDLEVPLANTIFHTGRPGMMSLSKWIKPQGRKGPSLETIDAKHAHIKWSWPNSEDFADSSDAISFSLPLVPITRWRRIEAGMGNIVRRLSDSVDKSGSIPASQELEKAVSAYFEVEDIAPHPMTVWALVYPAATEGSQENSDQAPTEGSSTNAGVIDESIIDFVRSSSKLSASAYSSLIWTALKKGARLHRVLSGGGGWGKKAGLLSLDPENSYSALSANADDAELPGIDAAADEKQALGEVARPGDYIQFFVTKSETTEEEMIQDAPVKDDINSLQSLHLGTIPSSVDVIPEDPSTASPASGKPKLELFKSHFGALSETGLSISIRRRTFVKRHPYLPDTVQNEEKTRTRVDVPFSTFRIQAADHVAEGQDDAAALRKVFIPQGANTDKARLHKPTDDSTEQPQGAQSAGFRIRTFTAMPSTEGILRRVEATSGGRKRYGTASAVQSSEDGNPYVYSHHVQYSEKLIPAAVQDKVQTGNNHDRRKELEEAGYNTKQDPMQDSATAGSSKKAPKVNVAQSSPTENRDPSKLTGFDYVGQAQETQHQQGVSLKQALTSLASPPNTQDDRSGVRIRKHRYRQNTTSWDPRKDQQPNTHPDLLPCIRLQAPPRPTIKKYQAQEQAGKVLRAQQRYLAERGESNPTITDVAGPRIGKLIHYRQYNPSTVQLEREARAEQARARDEKVLRAQQAHLAASGLKPTVTATNGTKPAAEEAQTEHLVLEEPREIRRRGWFRAREEGKSFWFLRGGHLVRRFGRPKPSLAEHKKPETAEGASATETVTVTPRKREKLRIARTEILLRFRKTVGLRLRKVALLHHRRVAARERSHTVTWEVPPAGDVTEAQDKHMGSQEKDRTMSRAAIRRRRRRRRMRRDSTNESRIIGPSVISRAREGTPRIMKHPIGERPRMLEHKQATVEIVKDEVASPRRRRIIPIPSARVHKAPCKRVTPRFILRLRERLYRQKQSALRRRIVRYKKMLPAPRIRMLRTASSQRPRRVKSMPMTELERLRARRRAAAEGAWKAMMSELEDKEAEKKKDAGETRELEEGRNDGAPPVETSPAKSGRKRGKKRKLDEAGEVWNLKEGPNDVVPPGPPSDLREGPNTELPPAPMEVESGSSKRRGRKKKGVARRTPSLDPEARALADDVEALLKGF